MPKAPNLLKDVQKLELDPTKQYILFLPLPSSGDKYPSMIEEFNAAIKRLGIDCIIVALDRPQDIRIVETPAHD